MPLDVDMRDFVAQLKQLDKKAASSIRKRLRLAVQKAGEGIVQQVRAEASWSTGSHGHGSIPKATSIRPNFTARSAGVKIVTSRTKAPYARAYEGMRGASFRHPVFGRGGWAVQAARPFFGPAIRNRDASTERLIQDAINEVARDLGFD